MMHFWFSSLHRGATPRMVTTLSARASAQYMHTRSQQQRSTAAATHNAHASQQPPSISQSDEHLPPGFLESQRQHEQQQWMLVTQPVGGGWNFGSKMLATMAAFMLVVGVLLTLLTVNAPMPAASSYRPVLFTVTAVLLIVLGPMFVCRAVISAYDRRLIRQQRQFDLWAEQMRVHTNPDSRFDDFYPPTSAAATTTVPSSSRQARASYDISDLFPEPVPSYANAVSSKPHEHWATKFFKGSPPPSYASNGELHNHTTLTPANNNTRRCETSMSPMHHHTIDTSSASVVDGTSRMTLYQMLAAGGTTTTSANTTQGETTATTTTATTTTTTNNNRVSESTQTHERVTAGTQTADVEDDASPERNYSPIQECAEQI